MDSLDEFNVADRYLSWQFTKRKLKNLGITLLSNLRKNWDWWRSSFSNFQISLMVFSLYLDRITSATDLVFGNRTLAKDKKTVTATCINILFTNITLLHWFNSFHYLWQMLYNIKIVLRSTVVVVKLRL